MTGPDLEQKLLCSLLAYDPTHAPFMEEVRGAAEKVDWQNFGALVGRHRVAALVSSGLEAAPGIAPPDNLQSALFEAREQSAQDYFRYVGLAAQLAGAFAKAGITCAVLKGIAVAERYYRQTSDREMIDVDILVDPSRYDEAEDIVRSLGFNRLYPRFDLTVKTRASFKRLHNAFTFFRREDRMQVDLHWRTVKNPALMPYLNDEWQNHLLTTPAANRELPTLEAGVHALYIIVHGAKHAWVRLKWLADLDRVVRGLSAEERASLIAASERNRMQRVVASSLALASELLGTPLEGEFRDLVGKHSDARLVKMQKAMIFGPLPGKHYNLGDTGQLIRRVQHSLVLHKGEGYRRAAVLREIARPEDLENVRIGPGALWSLPLISPFLALGRKTRGFFTR